VKEVANKLDHESVLGINTVALKIANGSSTTLQGIVYEQQAQLFFALPWDSSDVILHHSTGPAGIS
jgi:hypothetical protein